MDLVKTQKSFLHFAKERIKIVISIEETNIGIWCIFPESSWFWNPPFYHFMDTLNIICKNQMDMLPHDKSQSQLQ